MLKKTRIALAAVFFVGITLLLVGIGQPHIANMLVLAGHQAVEAAHAFLKVDDDILLFHGQCVLVTFLSM